MEQNRYAAQKKCEAARETLHDQLEETFALDFIRVLKGLSSFH